MISAITPGQRRLSNLNPLTDKQVRDAERDSVYIFNVSPREHRVAVGKIYTIPACPADAEVSAALIIPGIVYQTGVKKVSGLDVEYEWVGNDGIDVARDIVGTAPFKDASENLTRMGVFISMTLVPTEAEVAAAREQWYARCDEKVREADNAYATNNGIVVINGRSMSNIGKDAIEAAKVLGLSRPWADKNVRLTPCDECGTGNLSTAAKCKGCGVVLNEEAFKRKFPLEWAERQRVIESADRRGPGRPRNEVAA